MFQDKPLVNRTIINADVLAGLVQIPDRSISCVITSPPYYKVRDYGVDGQWGLEKDPETFLDRLGLFMQQIHRVLRDDGIAWINLGDCIIDGGWYGFPEAFFTNCRRAGWVSVSKPIWWKRNAMPSSTKIRLAPRYENIYGFTKSYKTKIWRHRILKIWVTTKPQGVDGVEGNDWVMVDEEKQSLWDGYPYYFNLDAIRIPLQTVQKQSFNLRVREAKKGKLHQKYGSAYTATQTEIDSHDNLGVKKQDSTLGADGKPKANYEGFNDRWKNRKMLDVPGQRPHNIHLRRDKGHNGPNEEYIVNELGKNPGDLLDITVKPFKDSHFATFPPDLPELLIKCSCPEGGWVLDPFCGAGTVPLVAEKLKRNWCGIEIKQSYIDLARQRIGI